MKKLIISTLILLISAPCFAGGDPHRSAARKGVDTSTDVVALALPAAALVGTLCMKDWKGLLQGVETAAVTAGVTYLLKYTVKEPRPDGSNLHSFPQATRLSLLQLLHTFNAVMAGNSVFPHIYYHATWGGGDASHSNITGTML